jgi:hypothetical protein
MPDALSHMRLPHSFSHGGQCAEQMSHHKRQEWAQQRPPELRKHHIGKQLLQSCSHPLVYIPNALSQLAQQHVDLQVFAKKAIHVSWAWLFTHSHKSVTRCCTTLSITCFRTSFWVLLENLLQACQGVFAHLLTVMCCLTKQLLYSISCITKPEHVPAACIWDRGKPRRCLPVSSNFAD